MAPSITEQSPVEVRNAELSAGGETAVSAPRNEPAADRAPVAPSLANPRAILVVDDQSTVCAAVAYYLEICGYKTFRAESGQAALEVFAREQIDGVLMDVQMPRLNGFETSKRLRTLAADLGRPFKVWFMTAVYYRESGEDCAAAGGISVFQKPFEWPQLLAELERGLNPPPSGSVPQTATDIPPPQA